MDHLFRVIPLRNYGAHTDHAILLRIDCREQGHKLVALDLSQDYSTMLDRPHLDLILLKMTDELVKIDKDPIVAQMVENARKLSVVYPKAVLVDPIDAQAGTIDRESMHRFFQKINALPSGTLLARFEPPVSHTKTQIGPFRRQIVDF